MDVVDNFVEECVKLSKLKHPNIMEIVGVCLDGGAVPFLVMPFMSNGNLLKYLKNNKKTFVLPVNNSPDKLVSLVIYFTILSLLNKRIKNYTCILCYGRILLVES